jgi:uncharacterized protein
MRAVIDTNVLVSGLLWRGPAYAVLQAVRSGELGFVSSPVLLAELAEVLARPKFAAVLSRTSFSRDALMAQVRQLAEVVDASPLAQPVCRDPDDDAVLAVAVAAQVDVIVSGDEDLLTLNLFETIPILSPQAALQRLQQVG